jgi:hypothetical protein
MPMWAMPPIDIIVKSGHMTLEGMVANQRPTIHEWRSKAAAGRGLKSEAPPLRLFLMMPSKGGLSVSILITDARSEHFQPGLCATVLTSEFGRYALCRSRGKVIVSGAPAVATVMGLVTILPWDRFCKL